MNTSKQQSVYDAVKQNLERLNQSPDSPFIKKTARLMR